MNIRWLTCWRDVRHQVAAGVNALKTRKALREPSHFCAALKRAEHATNNITKEPPCHFIPPDELE
jgi:hypothetical protein